MKKLFSTLALAAAISVPSFAQTERVEPTTDRAADVTMSTYDDRMDRYSDDYSKMVRAQYEVDFRKLAIDALHLNKEEIMEFSPLFSSYMDDKKMLMQRREMLVTKYGEEMAEDDTAQDEENETADFVENYWELDIDEMELQKDYFDRMEDEIGTVRALSFFDLEKMYADRLQRMALIKSLPSSSVLYSLEPRSYSYDRDVADYNNWNKINITGNVSLDHDYTYNGLQKLLTTTEKMVDAEGIMVTNFHDRKNMVMNKAAQMKKDWKSLNHADLAREAFTETAAILKEIANDSRFTANQNWINKLNQQAMMIDADTKLTDQAGTVKDFFSTAQYIVNDLVDQANGMTSMK